MSFTSQWAVNVQVVSCSLLPFSSTFIGEAAKGGSVTHRMLGSLDLYAECRPGDLLAGQRSVYGEAAGPQAGV